LDLAQACRKHYSTPLLVVLWVVAEVAIIATDLAEVLGSAIALQLLFGWRLEVGVLVTAVDVAIVFMAQVECICSMLYALCSIHYLIILYIHYIHYLIILYIHYIHYISYMAQGSRIRVIEVIVLLLIVVIVASFR
jgi:NRAMP (natural resistance-associated macrophage protein)-like metal ion transporter